MSLIYRPNHPQCNENGMIPRELACEPVQRSGLPFPMVISDQIELKSMVDGKTYTSKSSLRKSYRQQGYVEVGNEWLNKDFRKPEPKVDRKAIRNSVGKALARTGLL